MRRLTIALLTAALLVAAPACKRKRKLRVGQPLEEQAPLVTMVHAADPRSAGQLVQGFYNVEDNAWRWTKGKFAIKLRPPEGAADKGATLQLKFTIPEVVMAKLKTMKLSATVNGVALPSETYTQAGNLVYRREVPARALAGDAATVEFALDRFFAASAADPRELGLVFSSAGLEGK